MVGSGNHWETSDDPLWLMAMFFFPLNAVGWWWWGKLFSRFVFHISDYNRQCCWALFPFWHQYHFRTILLRWGYFANELTFFCRRLQPTCPAYLQKKSFGQLKKPLACSCFRSLSPLSLMANYQFPFERQWHWVLTAEFCCCCCHWTFFVPPFFSSFSVRFWRSLILAQRRTGTVLALR